MSLHALSWMGGKSYLSTTGTGRWIASLLPYDYSYSEPFFGMGGVLLQRDQSPLESVNDLDGNLTNWWLHLRDDTDALLGRLEWTENSHAVFKEALETLHDDDPLLRAWAFSVLAERSLLTPYAGGAEKWRRHKTRRANSRSGWKDIVERLDRVADRIQAVEVHQMDACEFIEHYASNPRSVVYCDPPYRSSAASQAYGISELDIDDFSSVVQAAKGFVAISGYEGEWDHLGWHAEVFPVSSSIAMGPDRRRLEVLWTNQVPRESLGLLDLL